MKAATTMSKKKKVTDDHAVAETISKATLASMKSFDSTEEDVRKKKTKISK